MEFLPLHEDEIHLPVRGKVSSYTVFLFVLRKLLNRINS